MYDFDKVVDRRETNCLKWNGQWAFGQKNGLIPFWIADTDFAAEPKILEAIKKRADHPIIGYSTEWEGVLDAISGWWERRHNWKPEKAWLYLSIGVVTTMYLDLKCLIPQGEKVLTFTPVYDPFFAAIKNSGHELVLCPLDHEDNRYTINYEKFEEELKNGVKAVVICNPHNPIARVWSEEELEKIVDLCVKYDAYLFSDEVHCDYAFTRPYIPAGKFTQIHDKLIMFTAVSKSFNMAGMCCSCQMIPNPELKQKIMDYYDSMWLFGPNDISYTVMEAAYTYADQWMDEAREYIQGNVKSVCDYMAENMPKIQVTEHEGTFLMWLDMNCFGMSSDEISEILVKEYGLAVGNGSEYAPEADGFMRFNVGCTRKTLAYGLEQMKKMYDKYVKG